MKIFARYLIREFASVFLASMLVLVGIFMINEAAGFIASLLVKGAGIIDLIKVFSLGIPSTFIFVIPISFVMGWVVAVSRMAGDLEILAVQSSGINPRRILKTTAASGIFVTLFLLYSNSTLSPESNLKMEEEIRRMLSKKILRISEKTFTRFADYIFFADKITNDEMSGIKIYRINNNFPSARIFASSGRLKKNKNGLIGLELNNGKMFLAESKDVSLLTSINFMRYSFTLNSEAVLKSSKRIVQLTSSVLKDRIKDFKARGLPAKNLDVEYNMRIALAFSAFFLALAGASFGIRVKSPKKVVGMGLAVLMIGAYYLVFMIGVHAAETGWLNPTAACWIPNTLCAAALVIIR